MNCKNIDYTLYLVTDSSLCPPDKLPQAVEKAIQGGVTMVQLREKNISTLDFYHIAHRVKAVTDQHQIPLLINDRIDIALAVNTDGVHIGQSDMPADTARRLIGPDKLLGVSANTVETALKAQADGADYIGFGAVFPTDTKKDASTRGVKAYWQVKNTISLPMVAIGGIHLDNVHRLNGADGIAVISAIMGQPDETEAARSLLSRFHGDKS